MSGEKTQISRVNRTRTEARKSYDRMSRWYDWVEGPFEKKPRQLGEELLGINPQEKVLEIGFGTGHSLSSFGRHTANKPGIVGIDISWGMCQIAHKRLRRKNLLTKIAIMQSDAVNLPIKDACFNVIYMSFVLELFDTPEIPLILAECQRILVPGGRIGVVAMSKKSKKNLLLRLYEWGHEHFPDSLDCRPIFTQHALEEAGFLIEKSRHITLWGLPVELVVAVND